MKPVSMKFVNSIVFNSDSTAKITAIFGVTRIKVKTKEGYTYSGEIIEPLTYGKGFVLNTELCKQSILFDIIDEIFYTD